MKKKQVPHIDMICSVEELADLFKRGQDIRGFLSQVVTVIRQHMDTDVCTIYLYNEKKDALVLQATDGLNPELIGNLTITPDEGLVGLAFQKLHPVREKRAQNNPRFKIIPNSGEDLYKSFLAVPIIRGTHRVGVLVLQTDEAAQFTESNTSALKAIASQLATTLESAQLLIEKPVNEKADNFAGAPIRFVRGTPVVEGAALGKAYHFEGPGADDRLIIACDAGYAETIAGFQKAITRTEEQLESLQTQLEEELADVASLIFSAHLLMLRDTGFSGAMEELIKDGSLPCEAVVKITNEYITIFGNSDNPRMREKVLDTKDLGHRILKNLIQGTTDTGDYSDQIILTNELLPSELLKLAAQKVEAIILFGGGTTAHITVLASSLQVPLIYTEDENIFRIPPNTQLALDAIQGLLFVQPDETVRKRILQLKNSTDYLKKLETATQSETHTTDGVRIHLRATVNLLSDIKLARRLNAEGIGLYRSEFPFLIRNDFPSEEEQYRIYQQVINGLDNPLITLRTLDVGGDKILSYIPDSEEANPFLGLRGIRFLLKNKEIFINQIKAMIRAGGNDGGIRILFPLISSLDDFRNAKDIVIQNLGSFPMPQLGAMIELPSAVTMAQELADEADFLSLGTNDLIQYMLGVDRTNEKVADLFDTCHPAVLRAVKKVAGAASQADCPLTICGIMSTDPRSVYYMMGLGVREFSLEPSKIPELQSTISSMSIHKAQQDTMNISALGTLAEIQDYFEKNGICVARE